MFFPYCKNGVFMQEHYMIREIKEGPDAIKKTYESVKKEVNNLVSLIEEKKLKSGFIIGSGTSFHASLVLQYLINRFTYYRYLAIPASEFIAWAPSDLKNDIIVAYSQSGESTDVIISVKWAKERGATVVGVTNTPGSTLTKLADFYLLTRAGEEKAVAATKTYDGQLMASSVIAYSLAKKDELIKELSEVNKYVEDVLKLSNEINSISVELKKVTSIFVLGRGVNYPNALEASLKLKETAMIHAEGFAVREFLHGPIQLVDEETPVIVIIPNNEVLEESKKTLTKLASYKANVIAVCGEDVEVSEYATKIIKVPQVKEECSIFPTIKAIQLLAYYASVNRGLNPDKPTKLTKVVK